MNINDLTIAQAKEIAGMFPQHVTYSDEPKHLGMQIVVLDRGYIYVGDVTDFGDHIIVGAAKNIRIWGTAKGLGELRSGPTARTIADYAGTVQAPKHAVILLIAVDEGSWV